VTISPIVNMCYPTYGGFVKWRYLEIIQVMRPFLVLKPMVTTGDPPRHLQSWLWREWVIFKSILFQLSELFFDLPIHIHTWHPSLFADSLFVFLQVNLLTQILDTWKDLGPGRPGPPGMAPDPPGMARWLLVKGLEGNVKPKLLTYIYIILH
jgi:hypothetical protein